MFDQRGEKGRSRFWKAVWSGEVVVGSYLKGQCRPWVLRVIEPK
jgi:hypothetical protein